MAPQADSCAHPDIQVLSCPGCGQTKPIDAFAPRKGMLTGRRTKCRQCISASDKIRNTANAERNRLRAAEWRRQHPDAAKSYYAANRERILANLISGQTEDTKAAKNKRERQRYRQNKEKALARAAAWRAANPDKVVEIMRRSRMKRQQSPKWRLVNAVRAAVWRRVKDKGERSTFALLGYTVDQLRSHLERQFLPGMTWDNYGAWHIDHIIPLSAFNFQSADHIDFGRAWALSNLQPLWATDNVKKHAKLDGEFQPSLAI